MAGKCEGGGYDLDLIGGCPEYLICVVCHLVLRDPVQVINCGHRYCHSCFEKIKGYAAKFKSVLHCPIDRKEIDLHKVYTDIGMARIIEDMSVKCVYHSLGCCWIGEVRNLGDHETKCRHASKRAKIEENSSASAGASPLVIAKILDRLSKCEEGLLEKKKELSVFDLRLKESEEKLAKRDEKIELLETEIRELKEDKGNEAPPKEMSKDDLSEIAKKIEIEVFQKVVEESYQLQIDNMERELLEVKYSVCGVCNDVDEVRAHINHTDGLLKIEKNISLKKTVFVWRINNFRELFSAGKQVESSKFYARPDGHLCQLLVDFPEKKHVNVRFRLVKRKNLPVIKKKFNVSINISRDTKHFGEGVLSPTDIGERWDTLFRFEKGETATKGVVCRFISTEAEIEDCMKEDLCTVTCTLIPLPLCDEEVDE